jgi:ribosomal protein S18 acetylase RimI-like enzyme
MTNPPVIVIRQAAVQDAASLRALRLEALQNKPEAFASDHEAESRDSVADWEERLAASDSTIFIADAGSELAGMAGAGQYRHTKTRHNAIIWGVYVKPAWRGRRLGGQLVEACIGWAGQEGLRSVRLGVITTNPAAINSYIRAGFRVYGVEPEVIHHDGVYYDELLMIRDVIDK